MKTLTKYQATDGVLCDTAADAERRDALCARVAAMEAILDPHPDDANQRTLQPRLADYRAALVVLCRELFPTEAIFQHEPESIHPMSYAGRFIDDAAPRVIGKAWWRLSCCHDGYEYQQPFFALHPDEWEKQTTARR